MTRRWMAGLMSVGMLATAGFVATAAPTGAVLVRTCSATFTPNPLPVGQSVHEVVSGFDANESITESVSINGGSFTDSTKQADASGVYDFHSGIAPPQAAGDTYSFHWLGQTSGATCSATFSVGDAVVTTTTTAPATTTTTAPATTTTAPAAKAAAVTAKPSFTG